MATGFYLLDHAVNNGTVWQQWGYPRRGAKLSGTCIMHTSESALDRIPNPDVTAEELAAFLGRRTGSYGSYHSVVDSDSIIELVPYEYESWQDSETNPWAVGISAACRTTDWATMTPEYTEGFYRNLAWCAADFVKYMKAAYNITVPLIRISGADARARKPGFCAHGDSGIARTDPGKDFNWQRFFKYTKEVLDGVVTTKEEDEMGVLDERVKQVGGGEVTLREIVAEFRSHQMQTRTIVNEAAAKVISAVAAEAAKKGNTLEEIEAVVRKAIAENVLSVDVKLSNKLDVEPTE